MASIHLTAPWTYRTPETTISFVAGEHTVSDVIAAAADAAGVLQPACMAERDEE